MKSIASRANGIYSSYGEERGGKLLMDAFSTDWNLLLFCKAFVGAWDAIDLEMLHFVVEIDLEGDGVSHA